MGLAVTQTEPLANAPVLRARDLMTSPAVVARESETVRDVARLMLLEGVCAVPVVDSSGALVGMVSDGDLSGRQPDERRGTWWLELLSEGAGAGLPQRGGAPIQKVMSAPPITISPRAFAQEVAQTLRVHRIKRLPVVEEGRVVGVVSRTDLLRVVEGIPGKGAEEPSEASVLSFFESLIGGVSLRGGFERPVDPPQGSDAEPQAQHDGFSAEAFRESVRAFKAESLNRLQLAQRQAELERRRQIEALLDQHLSDQRWRELLRRAELAASNGEREFLLARFPADLASDGGRSIGIAERGWEKTLRGEPAEIYTRWRNELKPLGFGLSARIVSFEDGVVGDLGLFLAWGE